MLLTGLDNIKISGMISINSAPHSPYAERRNLVCDTLGAFFYLLSDKSS